jgi:polyhydroxybutyrate depolymerase
MKRLLLMLTVAGCAADHSVEGRAYELHAPKNDDASQALTLVILTHGYGANGPLQDLVFPFSNLIDQRRFLYALPNGTLDGDLKRFWNATDACCNFGDLPVDDVGFFRALIADVKARHAVGKVFVIGHSNGAFMDLRLACEASDVIDGVAEVSGSAWNDFSRCPDGRPIPMLLIHGTDDHTIFYGGKGGGAPGEVGSYPSAHETGARYARRAGCDGAWQDLGRADFVGDATTETHEETIPCATPIELWSVEGADHVPSFNAAWTTAVLDWLEGKAP